MKIYSAGVSLDKKEHPETQIENIKWAEICRSDKYREVAADMLRDGMAIGDIVHEIRSGRHE